MIATRFTAQYLEIMLNGPLLRRHHARPSSATSSRIGKVEQCSESPAGKGFRVTGASGITRRVLSSQGRRMLGLDPN
jgi:hypothetical protein